MAQLNDVRVVRPTVDFDVEYIARFRCTHEVVIVAIEHETDNDRHRPDDELMVPRHWGIKERCIMRGNCWIEFTSEMPMVVEELLRAKEKMEILDAAADAMLRV